MNGDFIIQIPRVILKSSFKLSIKFYLTPLATKLRSGNSVISPWCHKENQSLKALLLNTLL